MKMFQTLQSKIGHWKFDNRGFTIVELLIYIGTMSVFLLVLTQIFTTLLEVQLKSEATSSLEQDSRYILSRLSYDLARADSIQAPTQLGSQSNTLQFTINGTEYSYSLQSNNLVFVENTTSYPMNSYGTTVSSLTFTRLGNPSGKHTIRYILTLTARAQQSTGSPVQKIIQSTVGLR